MGRCGALVPTPSSYVAAWAPTRQTGAVDFDRASQSYDFMSDHTLPPADDPKPLDLVIQGGAVFDGTGAPRRVANVGIRDGRVVAIDTEPLGPAGEVIDARGQWVMPGFIDFHTHYDAEVEIDPALFESVRHGVTTVFMGSCSLSAAIGTPEDIADIFCRVEGVPRDVMLPLLRERKDWETFKEYFEHLDAMPLGPNVTAFAGHSKIRMKVMGLERSVKRGVRPTAEEMAQMKAMLEEALDEGYVGLSIQTLPWDKLDGDRVPAEPLPSYFASWSEYRQLTRIVRRRERVFQGVPNVTTKINVALFLWESVGLFRKPLRTTIISLMDLMANRTIWWSIPLISRLFNKFLGADFRFQALPNVFDVWSDGMQLVIFEEFGAGTEAINVAALGQRAELLRDPTYRRRFRKQWSRMFTPRVYHRNFRHTEVLACPDNALVGRSFAEIAVERGQHVVDVFLDLCADYGDRLRWYSIMANDRRGPLQKIVDHPDILIGFSDAGAHLRNMAHYNFPLRLLKLARDAQERGEPFMSIERAVHRLTGEISDWFRIDAGYLAVGKRADIVVVDPKGLNDDVETAREAPMPGFAFDRLVRRNPDAVPAVIINGRVASRHGERSQEFGRERGFGCVLRAR